jgi:AbrB family looped-hinge helix DNA binding protein
MTTTVVDNKGRIVVPKQLRNEMRISEGSRVSVQIEKERLVVSRAVDPDEFIAEMEGFVEKGSRVPLVNPLSLKHIWEKA